MSPQSALLSRAAGEGDHAKHGGGGDPTHGANGRPLPSPAAPPSPASREKAADCKLRYAAASFGLALRKFGSPIASSPSSGR